MDTEYQQSIIEEAIKDNNIEVTSELLLLKEQIGDKLIKDHIIEPLKGLGFKQRQDDNGALWKSLNSKKIILSLLKQTKPSGKKCGLRLLRRIRQLRCILN